VFCAGPQTALDEVAKFLPVLSLAQSVCRSYLDLRASRRGPTQRVASVSFPVNDGAMTCDDYLQMFVGGSFDVNRFVIDLRFFPSGRGTRYFIRRGWV